MKKNKPKSALQAFRESQAESNDNSVFQHETEVSEALGGQRSQKRMRTGSQRQASDGFSDRYQIECKQTVKKQIAIKTDWLFKISEEARSNHREPLVSIRFLNLPNYVDADWVMVPLRHFKKINGD